MKSLIPNPEKQQHFLENKKILKKQISLAKLSKKDKVIEIGAGDGRLTKLISPKVKFLTSFETDKKFKPILNNLKLKNTKFIFENALKHSWKNHNKIVANIPYSLSEPLIQKSIKEGINEITIIVGEKLKKVLEEKITKIGILANLYFEINYIQRIISKEFPNQNLNHFRG